MPYYLKEFLTEVITEVTGIKTGTAPDEVSMFKNPDAQVREYDGEFDEAKDNYTESYPCCLVEIEESDPNTVLVDGTSPDEVMKARLYIATSLQAPHVLDLVKLVAEKLRGKLLDFENDAYTVQVGAAKLIARGPDKMKCWTLEIKAL